MTLRVIQAVELGPGHHREQVPKQEIQRNCTPPDMREIVSLIWGSGVAWGVSCSIGFFHMIEPEFSASLS